MKKHTFLGLIAFMAIALTAMFAGCDGKKVLQSESDLIVSKIYKTAQNLGFEGSLPEFLELVKGCDGVGIFSLDIDDDGNLLIILTDLTEISLGKVKGKDGADGINGANGVGIKDVYLTDNGSLVVLYTDGTENNLGVIKGDKGETGAQGDKGEAGAQGDKGEAGAQGETGVQGETGAQGETGETSVQGETGAQGETGKPGVGIGSMYIGPGGLLYVLFTDSDTPICIGDIRGENGEQGTAGLSAYELYVLYNPDYTKTEAEWIEDLSSGLLSKKEHTVTVVCGKKSYSVVAKNGENADFSSIVYERKGYNFLHWESNGKIFDVNATINKNITVTAVYESAELEVNQIFNNIESAPVTLDAMTKTRIYINYYQYYRYDLTFIGEGGTIVLELFQSNGDRLVTETFEADGKPFQPSILDQMPLDCCYIEIEYRSDDDFPLTVVLEIYKNVR